jgi:hypothetical protein
MANDEIAVVTICFNGCLKEHKAIPVIEKNLSRLKRIPHFITPPQPEKCQIGF